MQITTKFPVQLFLCSPVKCKAKLPLSSENIIKLPSKISIENRVNPLFEITIITML